MPHQSDNPNAEILGAVLSAPFAILECIFSPQFLITGLIILLASIGAIGWSLYCLINWMIS